VGIAEDSWKNLPWASTSTSALASYSFDRKRRLALSKIPGRIRRGHRLRFLPPPPIPFTVKAIGIAEDSWKNLPSTSVAATASYYLDRKRRLALPKIPGRICHRLRLSKPPPIS
jgi:hypothetical protein